MIETAALIIDGSRSARFAIGRLLADLGCPADSCGNLDEALEYLQTYRPQLVLVDERLTQTDTLSELRILPGLAAATIVISTADDAPDLAALWQSRGAAGLLVKPPSHEQLATLLSELLPDRLKVSAAAWTPSPTPASAYPATTAAMPAVDLPDAGAEAIEQRTRALEEQIAGFDEVPASNPPPTAPADSERSLEERLSQLEQRMLDLERHIGAQWQAAIEEARLVAEQTVTAAAESISDRLAESILKTLGRT